ncbi:TerC family protein [Pontibacillus sp. HMF3514]|uniref:TerC family protein n=1 Tax=Pontibacillus sp. HMF3514 TaxID=2692425 RepID=UPI0013200067|nr:TerC family protein [Pontibacillus sp. HMF3514]QHE52441.1 hypothetical protein GS400_10525 [Pontibacillus sp. HMF3514]
MDFGLWLEYSWVFLVIIGLEGILAADNALVMALMVKHLPDKQQRRALLYGLGGAFVFRFISLFLISFLVHIWQVQALGAAYLLYISIKFLVKKHVLNKDPSEDEEKDKEEGSEQVSSKGFWKTVLKVEITDIVFAIDSILAAVALASSLPETSLPKVGDLDGAKFGVILAGGLAGVILIRVAASYFVKILQEKKGLQSAAYIIVGWVGVKLLVHVLAHKDVQIIPKHFPESITWKVIFWTVLLATALIGWFASPREKQEESNLYNEQKERD